ncbi:hypothetical protein N4R57_18355 [Rhodobacteraceae bacterium D3-12]|nr:hypothetical protein N4R57_18355 [Rhodobacteraceae bacterium D3-12]
MGPARNERSARPLPTGDFAKGALGLEGALRPPVLAGWRFDGRGLIAAARCAGVAIMARGTLANHHRWARQP